MSELTNKFLNRMFRRVGGLVWDLTSGKLGIKDENGIYTLELTTVQAEGRRSEGVNAQIVVNPFDSFGVDIPAFATSTKLADVAVGDVIVGESSILGWVVEKKEASLVLLDKAGMRKQYNPPKVAVLGTDNNVLVVKNLLNAAGGETGLAGLQGNLLPLLMLGEDVDFESIIPMLLFSQQSGANAGMGNLLPLLMMKNGGLGDIDPMMLMMMSGGLGGGAGAMNPMMLMAMSGGLKKGSRGAPNALAPSGPPPLVPASRPGIFR